MCLILFAYEVHPHYRLIMAANRDEFYNRPTAPLEYWQDQTRVLAGRDLTQMGTWLGITSGGRLAAVTNYRDSWTVKTDAPSRGHLVSDFLTGGLSATKYLGVIKAKADTYNGFNLLAGDPDGLYYYGNRGKAIQSIAPGFYGLSNHLLNTPWPKVQSGINGLRSIMALSGRRLDLKLSELMQSRDRVSDDQLPDTGVGLEWERMLAPIFIAGPTYGTRCTSILTIDHSDRVHFKEITWQPARFRPELADERDFRFTLSLHKRTDTASNKNRKNSS